MGFWPYFLQAHMSDERFSAATWQTFLSWFFLWLTKKKKNMHFSISHTQVMNQRHGFYKSLIKFKISLGWGIWFQFLAIVKCEKKQKGRFIPSFGSWRGGRTGMVKLRLRLLLFLLFVRWFGCGRIRKGREWRRGLKSLRLWFEEERLAKLVKPFNGIGTPCFKGVLWKRQNMASLFSRVINREKTARSWRWVTSTKARGRNRGGVSGGCGGGGSGGGAASDDGVEIPIGFHNRRDKVWKCLACALLREGQKKALTFFVERERERKMIRCYK